MTTSNSIWIEPDGFSDDESAVARVTAAGAGGSVAPEFAGPFATE
jgi:hypothetical protein